MPKFDIALRVSTIAIDTAMVALDSNAMTYLIDGLNYVSCPPLGREAWSKKHLCIASSISWIAPAFV
jgi:hypothetical protein